MRRYFALTLVAALGGACSDEERKPALPIVPEAGTDADRDATASDAGIDHQAPDTGEDARPTGPTRGNCGDTAWSERFGGSPAGSNLADEQGFAVATTPTGDLIVTGWYEGDADFGGGPRSAGGENVSMFVARFGADGSHVFSRGFGDSTPGLLYAPHARGRAVAIGAGDSLLIGGQFAGSVDFGSGALSSRETPLEADAGADAGLGICFTCVPDAVVLKLDATGTTQWVKQYGSDGSDLTRAVEQGANDVIAAGTVEGHVDFGGGITTPNGAGDAFVLALDGAGNYAWARRFAGTGEDDAFDVAIDRDGNILVVGGFTETLTIGSDTLSSPGRTSGFVAKLDSGGNPLWAQAIPATQLALGLAVAVDAAGNSVVVGSFRGTMNLGGAALISQFNDVFVLKLDAAGNHLLSRNFGGVQNDEADTVAIDASGRIFVAGAVGSDRVDFGGGPITGGRSDDLFLLTLGPDGQHLCSRRYGSANGSSSALGLALDQDGNALVSGALSGTVDFGSGALASTGGLDIILAKFNSGPTL